MTNEDIEMRVSQIAAEAADFEKAHGLEDSLYADFIAYVASLEIPLARKAQRVLSTRQIRFQRVTS